MSSALRRALAVLLVVSVLPLTSSCVYDKTRQVETPASAFAAEPGSSQIIGLTTTDGTVVRFRKPARIDAGDVCGRTDAGDVRVPWSGIRHLLVQQRKANTAKTVLTSVLVVAGVVGVLALVVASTKQSCPFLYSWNGREWVFDAEPYGGAVTRGLERADDVLLEHLVDVGGRYRILMTNEVKETQRTDFVALRVVDHAPGVRVVPGAGGRLHAIGAAVPPASARTADGRDVTAWLSRSDELALESAPAPGPDGGTRDEIVLEFPKPAGASRARLVVNAGTTLFGSYMIRESLKLRGRELGDWYTAVDSDPAAVAALDAWHAREELWLLRIDVDETTGWETRGALLGTGPLVVKERVVPIDVSRSAGPALRLRVRPPKGFWRLDSFAVDYGPDVVPTETLVPLASARDAAGGDHLHALASEDAERYVLPIGGAPIVLTFDAPPLAAGKERSIFVRARGYYTLDLEGRGEPDRETLDRLLLEPGYGVRLAAARFPVWQEEMRDLTVARP